jgi:hypothetical protein
MIYHKGVSHGDLHIGVLRSLYNNSESSNPLKELIEFILQDVNFNEVNRLSSLLFLCQKIFEADPLTLCKMQEQVIKGLVHFED